MRYTRQRFIQPKKVIPQTVPRFLPTFIDGPLLSSLHSGAENLENSANGSEPTVELESRREIKDDLSSAAALARSLDPQLLHELCPLTVHQRLGLGVHDNFAGPRTGEAFTGPLAGGVDAHF